MRYILGEELTQKLGEARGATDDAPLAASQKTELAEMFAEARRRPDLGARAIWRPEAGGGTRPSAVYARGVISLETAAAEIEAIARTQPRVKTPVQHIILSLNESESATVDDETLIRAAEFAVDQAGFAGHQAVFAVHRDTPDAHVHVAVGAVHPETLRAWIRNRNYYRLHEGMRQAEIAYGFGHDHGLAVVRDPGLQTQRIEWATKEERMAWARERGLARERLEDRARSYLSDSDGLELPEDRRDRIVFALRRMLETADERKETPLQADVYLIAAEHAATIERGPEGELLVRLMQRAEPGTVAREGVDELGDPTQRLARWMPSDQVFPLGLADVAPGPLDDAAPGTLAERAQQAQAERRRAWLTLLGDVAESEREVAELLEKDPGRVTRDIVAGGSATFTLDDVDRWTCSRLSDYGPDWAEHVLRADPTIRVRSADTEHPLFTTDQQLELETRVFAKASRLAQERDPLFNPDALERAIADEEDALGIRFTNEQRRLFDLLQFRFSVIQGDAGSGKSTLMAVQRRYCELTGREIAGFATSQFAAETLGRRARIRSVNSARALALERARGKEMIAVNSRAIIDETSMFSFEAADEMFDRLERAGAGAVFIGDQAQLANIAAGDTMRVLAAAAKEHGAYAEATQVYRQRESSGVAWMREAVPRGGRAIREADAAGVRAYFQEFIERGHVVFHADRKAEVAAKAQDLLEAAQRGERVIAPGFRHQEALYANRQVRRALGHEGSGIAFRLERGVRELSVGDRVMFTKNAESRLGVLNGYVGTVRAVEPRRVEVELDSGRTVAVDPVKYPHLEWAWACTTHKSQGQGEPLAVASLTKDDTVRSAHVAVTRCEAGLRVHTRMTPDEFLEHLSSPAAIRPTDDALLFEDAVRRTGGPDTDWARAVRRALEQDGDLLRQQHRAEMRERSEGRGRAIAGVLERYGELRARADAFEESKREGRIAQLAAAERRELETVYERYELESFVSWAVRRKRDIELGAPLLERYAHREDERRTARREYETEKIRDQERTIDRDPGDETKKGRGRGR
ncbi:MAG: AAA family ATPase [Candidatus Baltobacteraceae bacterium]